MEKVPIPVPFPPPAAVDDVDSTLGKDVVNTLLTLCATCAHATNAANTNIASLRTPTFTMSKL